MNRCGDCLWLRPLWLKTRRISKADPADAPQFSESSEGCDCCLDDRGICKAPYPIVVERLHLPRGEFVCLKSKEANGCAAFWAKDNFYQFVEEWAP